MDDYNKVLRLLSYSTLYFLYEDNNSELSDYVVRGIKSIIQHSLNLNMLDSNAETYGERGKLDYKVVKIYTSFEYVKEKPVEDFSLFTIVQNIIETFSFIFYIILYEETKISNRKILYRC